jgi:hypothetical protein
MTEEEMRAWIAKYPAKGFDIYGERPDGLKIHTERVYAECLTPTFMELLILRKFFQENWAAFAEMHKAAGNVLDSGVQMGMGRVLRTMFEPAAKAMEELGKQNLPVHTGGVELK